MSVPIDRSYSKSHEWIQTNSDIATIGVTDHAQSELGDIVYLELPEPGRILAKDEIFGTVESVKAVSDLYSPLSGEVIEINRPLCDATEVVNSDPYESGWMIKVRLANTSELAELMDGPSYDTHLASNSH